MGCEQWVSMAFVQWTSLGRCIVEMQRKSVKKMPIICKATQLLSLVLYRTVLVVGVQ